ncbi:AlkZ-related protein [Gorillibacterium sp. sgz500922]|uniref:AlkZ-related protein n=1 Tax=Gorillibacterium sp. sgz500922 TaxID=3446694 RepID=UPI003F667B07
MSTTPRITTYEEARELVQDLGILPLAPAVPDHPSFAACTPPEAWHTGEESDPWTWRVRFPAAGDAAYGKFFRGKSVLIAPDLFPLLKTAASRGASVRDRYRDGLLPREALVLYETIEASGRIDTRELRAAAGMKARESKAGYERGIRALQEAMDVVVTGAHVRYQADGRPSGWSSVSYALAETWMSESNIEPEALPLTAARRLARQRLEEAVSPEALLFFRKLYLL